MDEGNNHHPIACEACRIKKSKCDRDLPICSQCASSGATCRYSPTNKRGIPSGYIALIEQRLLESETVIFELLSALYNCNASIEQHRLSFNEYRGLSEWSKAQSKSKKVEEWANFPLATDDQRRNWWLKRQEVIGRAGLSDTAQGNSPDTLGILPDALPLSPTFDEIPSGISTNPFMLSNQAVTGTEPGIQQLCGNIQKCLQRICGFGVVRVLEQNER